MHRERMLCAIQYKPVDRVPFCTYNLYPGGGTEHDRDPSYRDLLALVWEKAGMLCKISPKAVWAEGDEEPSEVAIEERDSHRIETVTLHTPRGDLRQVTVTPPDQPAMVTEHFIKSDEDIARYLSLPHRVPQTYDPSNLHELERRLDGRGMLHVSYGDPMYAAAALFDFEDFTIRCVTRPETLLPLIEYWFERTVEATRRRLRACAGMRLLFCTSGPEVATPPMLPPQVFHRLVVPYHKRLVAMIHEGGQLAGLHCHGRVARVLDGILEVGWDMMEPIEPPPQGDIALPDLLDRCAGRIGLVGHIQDQEFHSAPPGTMTRRVEAIARAVGGRTGYVMSPTCTPFQHPASPVFLRNYSEWIEAADRLL